MKLLGQRPLPWVARGGARQLVVVHAELYYELICD